MASKRKLQDLYKRETTIKLDDGNGPVEVLIRKMSPVDYERAYRKANALRAKILAVQGEESEYYNATMNEVVEMDHDSLVEQLASAKTAHDVQAIEAEVGAEEKWSKEEYLQGLIDSWEDLAIKYAEDPEDEEAKVVLEKLTEYRDEVNKAISDRLEHYRDTYRIREDEDLRAEVAKDMLKLNADVAWMSEFRRWEIFLSCYNPEDGTRVFQTRAEVDELPPQVLNPLATAIEDLIVDMTEGKDSSQLATS